MNIERATGNLQNVKTILASYANVRDVLKYDRLVISPEAVPVIEGILALPDDPASRVFGSRRGPPRLRRLRASHGRDSYRARPATPAHH